jgi:tetratricopeptide (TPR) repeat protein
MNFSEALSQAREHTSIVQRMEHVLRSDPLNERLALGLGSARRRAERSQQALESLAESSQIDLIRYRLIRSSDVYAVEAVADSVHAFQRSFTGAADYLESGPKQEARFSREIEDKTRLNFAYTFPGSLGIVLAVENKRANLFREGEYDQVMDVFDQFLAVSDEHEAIDASRKLGSALIRQLCRWVDVNAKWDNSVDFVLKRGDGIRRGEYVPKNRFVDLSGIFHEASDEEPYPFEAEGILVGLDIEIGNFHFVVPGGDSYKGSLAEDFVKEKTTVGARYVASLVERRKRVVATGVETRSFTLKKLARSAELYD